jgi:hypothetical protein
MTRPKVPPGKRRVSCCCYGPLSAKLIHHRPKAADGAGVRELQAAKAEGEYRPFLFRSARMFSAMYSTHPLRRVHLWTYSGLLTSGMCGYSYPEARTPASTRSTQYATDHLLLH